MRLFTFMQTLPLFSFCSCLSVRRALSNQILPSLRDPPQKHKRASKPPAFPVPFGHPVYNHILLCILCLTLGKHISAFSQSYCRFPSSFPFWASRADPRVLALGRWAAGWDAEGPWEHSWLLSAKKPESKGRIGFEETEWLGKTGKNCQTKR